MTRIYAIAAAAVVIAVLAGLWMATLFGPDAGSDDQFAQCRSSRIAGGAGQIGGPFTLLDSTGKTVSDSDVITAPSLLYFGYTFCPDVCPLDVSRNVEAVSILEERGQILTPVFISIDPKRDTPEAVGDFAANHHPRMIGLTGTPEQVHAASQAYRTYYKAQDGDEDYYLVDHSTFSYLVLPGHGFVEFFRRELDPEQLADKVGCFLDKS